MLKWGDFDSINTAVLRRAHDVLAHQQRLAGGEVAVPAFSPGAIIGTQGIHAGIGLQMQHGPLRAFHSLSLDMFMLGYLYALFERGEMDDSYRQEPAHINCRRILVGIGRDEVGPDDEPIEPSYERRPSSGGRK